MDQWIRDRFESHIELVERTRDLLGGTLVEAARALGVCLRGGGTVLACGNGGSAADAQHFVTELVVQYHGLRRALPAVALTADTALLTAAANDFGFEAVFARQVEALGRPGDVLIAITTSGNSPNVRRASETALARGLHVIALSGREGGQLAAELLPALELGTAHLLCVPGTRTDAIQEVHILLLHLLCELVERELRLGPAS